MEANSSLLSYSGLGELEGDRDGGGHSSCQALPFFISLLLLAIVTVALNSILLLLIPWSWQRCTSLNIVLLSLSILNLLTSFNQVSLAIAIVRGGWVMGKAMCHVVAFVQFFHRWATMLVHLLISRDRYQVSKDPLSWQRNRRKVLIVSIVIWLLVGIAGASDRVLHLPDFEDDTSVDYVMCYWPSTTPHHANIPYRFTLQLLYLLAFLFMSATIYYTHYKVFRELRANERMKEQEAKMASMFLTNNLRKKTSGERALESLVIIFTFHVVSLLPAYVVDVVRHGNSLTRPTQSDLIHQVGLLTLTCISYVTAISPFVLLFNHRFKQHMKAVLQCHSDPEERNKLADVLIGATTIRRVQTRQLPKSHPDDITIFLSNNTGKYTYKPPHSQSGRRWSIDSCSTVSVTLSPVQLNNFFHQEEVQC